MKVVLFCLCSLIVLPVSVRADVSNNTCTSNYYEVNGKRTCLLSVGTENNNISSKTVEITSPESGDVSSEADDLHLQAIDPNVSDPGPDPR